MRRAPEPIRAAALLSVLAVSLALVACGRVDPTPSASAWNHDPADGQRGPEAWGEIDPAFEACAAGAEQSPVDLVDAVDADLPPLEFDYAPVPLVVENTGHTIEVPMPEDGAPQTLTVGEDTYRLVQFHVHAPSEHTVDGVSHDLELHLVHREDAGELVVIGVLFDIGNAGRALLDRVITGAPEAAGEEAGLDVEASPLELLPDVAPYVTYPGSLTTPGCTEGVRWIVLEERRVVSQAAVDRLHELIAGFPGYDAYANNNRPIQPLEDREIQTSD
jgi:carbonic anhydrase